MLKSSLSWVSSERKEADMDTCRRRRVESLSTNGKDIPGH